MTRKRSAREIKSNYNPLFDGVSAEKEARERDDLRKVKELVFPKTVPPQSPGGLLFQADQQQGDNNRTTVNAPASQCEGAVLSVPSIPGMPKAMVADMIAFDEYICDACGSSDACNESGEPIPTCLYVSEHFDVIGWGGPEANSRSVINRLHDGFRRNFYKLTPALWRKICAECDKALADLTASNDTADEIFAKLDPVVEWARSHGWPMA